MSRLTVGLLVLLVAGCDSGADEPARLWDTLLGIELGDSMAEVQQKLGALAPPEIVANEEGPLSSYAHMSAEGNRLLIHLRGPSPDTPPEDRRVEMISVGPHFEGRTEDGIGIGTERRVVRALLGEPAPCPSPFDQLDLYYGTDRLISFAYDEAGARVQYITLWEKGYAQDHGTWSFCE